MRDKLEQRLEQLRAELAKGQRVLVQLDQQRAQTVAIVERIRGAVQVLEELLAGADEPPLDDDRETDKN